MPGFEMTAEEANRYGATLNIWQAIRMLNAWQPLVGYGQRFMAETDPYKRGLIVAEAIEWLASKTDSKVDDELVALMAELVRTPQGEAVVRWAISKVEAIR